MQLNFQCVFTILTAFECLSMWKMDTLSGKARIVVLESPKLTPFNICYDTSGLGGISEKEIGVKKLVSTLWKLLKRRVYFICRQYLPSLLKGAMRNLCRVAVLCALRTYQFLIYTLKRTAFLTVPALAIMYLFQYGCCDEKCRCPEIIAWFIIVKVCLTVFCRLILNPVVRKFTEIQGGKMSPDEDSDITR